MSQEDARYPDVSARAAARRRVRQGVLAGARSLLLVSCLSLGAVHAQLLADVMVATAISATFDSTVRFPSGSLSAQGPGADALIASVPGSGDWTDWEVYVARGVAANLQAGFVHTIATGFAVAGYFEAERAVSSTQTASGPQVRTRILFDGGDGTRRLLYLIRSDQEVAWLIARSR
jgi:hypothetical protein